MERIKPLNDSIDKYTYKFKISSNSEVELPLNQDIGSTQKNGYPSINAEKTRIIINIILEKKLV